ncbi:UPF0755 protein [Bisgaardia hudsonensis]|uniref:Endolytic murein transglycosylase n=1 Tax=Bisgaardia hudsonensis TaxID=109472 RepID=A0A4R2MZX6_9PAST|nr:endolytic transglycosylase MltG [Bisgaardia hudsonensis]QLB13652.1 cell division protein YceG [Bisgaardia hudsonensis]TCP11985.1 UPF0755 protein [Bisgaardia hudsonensis]
MKKCLFILLLLIALAITATYWGYTKINTFINQPIQKSEQLLTIERGTTSKKLATLLEQKKILTDAQLLPYLLKLQPQLNKIKAGTYSLEGIENVNQLLTLFNSGKEVQFQVQFIEGKTFNEWRKDLEKAPHLQQTLMGKRDQDIFQLLVLPDYAKPKDKKQKLNYEWQNLDGWLYADTYSYTPNSTDLELLKRAANRLVKTLEQAWQQRDKDLPLKTPYEMLILASIVEKETGIAAERPRVASVFINRLNKGMKLQTDPTVIYGMGDNYNGNIRKKDLETATAYNTYVIDGLPPTPIAMVTESAIQAVAHPEKTDFLYFVADGTGGHKFTKNLADHNRAVKEYLRWYRNQK